MTILGQGDRARIGGSADQSVAGTRSWPEVPVAGLGRATHVFPGTRQGSSKDMDARDKPGHAGLCEVASVQNCPGDLVMVGRGR